MNLRQSTANLIGNARRNKQVSTGGGAYPGIIFVRDDTCNVKERLQRNETGPVFLQREITAHPLLLDNEA